MGNESERGSESESLKETVSERSGKALKGSPSVSESRFGVDYPIRNYRLSPQEVEMIIDLLSPPGNHGLPAETADKYKKIALGLRRQLDRWIEYYLECENAKKQDVQTAGI